MNSRLYIKDYEANKLIEVLKPNSLKAQLLLECSNENVIQNQTILNIDKGKLRNKIVELISLRKSNPPIDFGNRFEYEQCYQRKKFEGLEYELETSGSDNLIIFAINIYDIKTSTFLITDQQN